MTHRALICILLAVTTLLSGCTSTDDEAPPLAASMEQALEQGLPEAGLLARERRSEIVDKRDPEVAGMVADAMIRDLEPVELRALSTDRPAHIGEGMDALLTTVSTDLDAIRALGSALRKRRIEQLADAVVEGHAAVSRRSVIDAQLQYARMRAARTASKGLDDAFDNPEWNEVTWQTGLTATSWICASALGRAGRARPESVNRLLRKVRGLDQLRELRAEQQTRLMTSLELVPDCDEYIVATQRGEAVSWTLA